MVTVVGNSTALLPLNEQELAERFNDQKAIYDGVSLFLAQRGSQPLDVSMFATGKPSGRLMNRKPLNNLKANGAYYRNIANGYKGNASGPFVASAPTAAKSFVDTFITASVANTETKSAAGTPSIISDAASETKSKPVTGTLNNTSGVNPEAKSFVPAARSSSVGNPGLASNDKFMASARKFLAGGGLDKYHRDSATKSSESSLVIKPRDAPTRVLLFKNVPDWLNISDVLGFVYGGAIDCIFRSNRAEITVQFCEEAACEAYLEAHPKGIRVQNPGHTDEAVTINVEKAPRGEEVSPALQVKIASEGSRLVRVDGMFDTEKLQALTAHGMEYEVDHVLLLTEKDKMGSAYFFFCGLADGWTFKQKLQEDEAWAEFVAAFMADPCEVATAFHENTIPNRMASAVAVV